MSENVWVKCGKVMDILPNGVDNTPVTGATTGNWIYKDSPYATFQAILNGTGAISAVVTIQGSNDGVNAVSSAIGTITLNGTTTVSDGFATISSWKYVRAVVSSPTGTISRINVLLGV